jgi:hypothetical protein
VGFGIIEVVGSELVALGLREISSAVGGEDMSRVIIEGQKGERRPRVD